MELILNELSVQDLTGTPHDARQAMNALLLLCKKAKYDMGCNGLRLPNADFFNQELVAGYTLIDWMTEPAGNRTLQTLFNGLRRLPYFEDLEEAAENEYILSRFYLNEPEHPAFDTEVHGLANAWLKRSLSVSFCSHPVWSKCQIGLTIDRNETGTEDVEVYHACVDACLNDDFKEWFRKEHLPPLRTHEDVDVWFPVDQFNLTDQAKDDLILMYEENLLKLIGEVENMIKEIQIDPMKGTGKPKTLKGDLAGWMSRRITDKHRLVYKLEENVLNLYRCYDHYDDK
ncbi:MAG: Txe/YoeB family addiction module toxin [Saprospiraceae bacterium]|nr:MAG: Txe/YoeB family addiction module toxin [Saprospiraceae bacterium]